MPTSAMAATAAGFTSAAGFGTAGPCHGPIAGEVVEPAERHLGPARIVHAEEQHGRSVISGHVASFVVRVVEVGVGCG